MIPCRSSGKGLSNKLAGDAFGVGPSPETKAEKFDAPEVWTVELALDLAGWKPALLDAGTGAFL